MADFDNIQELRAEVLRRQKAANAKIGRLRRKGVSLAGTNYDVRREPTKVGRYNRTQLQSYLGQLDSFVSRRNAFVGGAEGAPIPRQAWNSYKRTERAYQEVVQQHYEPIKDIFIPQVGKTVQGYDDTMRRKRAPGRGGVPRPLESGVALDAFEVASVNHLVRMQKNLERKLDKGYLPEELAKQRQIMTKAVEAYNDPDLTKLAKNLTDDQLDSLWNYSPAPYDLFEGYHVMKLLATGNTDERDANIHEDDADEARAWLEWAAALPAREQQEQQKQRKGRR